ncbi:DUF479 domain-containing protein [Cryomorpha ignava]|uniref:DUF479 domain-containing protein n=1 Tax=Cryomorpha ignava TaxID=101383 RepID=A0A7K3WPN8_9FLAO|nr:acyl carrier protein phosphodiesterase [Cryomorpha ignava]NEN23623.1 DUF479 domain-containing protein [Cryomorpha ignava]
MNFLAHQYLSFHSEPVMVGNFIADTINGVIPDEYPEAVKLGIQIHRSIDTYTDSHPIVLETRKLLYPWFSKYAAVVQDVYYDHFLAINWHLYSKIPLAEFVNNVYAVLSTNEQVMNEKALRILHYMKLHDWLYNYSKKEGIDRALKGLSRRATFKSNMEKGLEALDANYTALNQHFQEFFPQLENEINRMYGNELNNDFLE